MLSVFGSKTLQYSSLCRLPPIVLFSTTPYFHVLQGYLHARLATVMKPKQK